MKRGEYIPWRMALDALDALMDKDVEGLEGMEDKVEGKAKES